MPSTTKVITVDENLCFEQTTLKRGTKVKDLQTKNDIDSKLMQFFKIVPQKTSPAMAKFIHNINSACEELAQDLESNYNNFQDIVDNENGDGFFTETIEGMKSYCALSLSKVQSDAKRTVLIDSGQVPVELWEVDSETASVSEVSSEAASAFAGLKKD